MKELTLREWRKKRGMTQDDLAEKSGVSQDTISDIEVGRHPNPRVNTLGSLADALRVHPAQIRLVVAAAITKRHGRRPAVGVGL